MVKCRDRWSSRLMKMAISRMMLTWPSHNLSPLPSEAITSRQWPIQRSEQANSMSLKWQEPFNLQWITRLLVGFQVYNHQWVQVLLTEWWWISKWWCNSSINSLWVNSSIKVGTVLCKVILFQSIIPRRKKIEKALTKVTISTRIPCLPLNKSLSTPWTLSRTFKMDLL